MGILYGLGLLVLSTNVLHRPIRGEAGISPDHVRHKITSTFDAQTDANGNNRGEKPEK